MALTNKEQAEWYRVALNLVGFDMSINDLITFREIIRQVDKLGDGFSLQNAAEIKADHLKRIENKEENEE